MKRNAFTLAELLVTITIILLLSGISLRVLVVAQEYARADKTRATIAKINHEVMAAYESYRLRQLPASVGRLPGETASAPWPQLMRRRLDATRDLMRMEMPDRWSDVIMGPLAFNVAPYTDWWPNGASPAYNQPWCKRGALSAAYLRRLLAARSRLIARGVSGAEADAMLMANASAECLYLMVNQRNAEAREFFLDSEVGDTDGDQLFEFLDGWGRPIAFLRWAPAFTDSDLQTVVYDRSSALYNVSPGPIELSNGTPTVVRGLGTIDKVVQNDHDPFDPNRVDRRAWRLLPLVYSAGGDGDYGIGVDDGASGAAYVYNGNPFGTPDRYPQPANPPPVRLSEIGRPAGTAHLDNIHNHRGPAR